jgi:hypothetical protein
MWWDSSDRARLTRRSDVAFWLHLLAAPMIVQSKASSATTCMPAPSRSV